MSPREQLQLQGRESLVRLGQIIVPGMFTVKSPPFHYELEHYLLDPTYKKLNIIAPRGHAKTSLAGNLLPIHHLLYGPPGPKFIVLVSKTLGHAKDLIQWIKDVLDYSREFRAIFGYWGKHSATRWHAEDIILKDGSRIICKSSTQQLRGLKHGFQRPTLVIYDDPQDEENTRTDDALEKAKDGLFKAIEPGVDPFKGRIVLIGTPVHQSGLVNICSEMDSYHTLHYRSLTKPGVNHGMFTIREEEMEQYIPLWPEWMPVEKLVAKYNDLAGILKTSAFYSEYQCEIVGDSERLFPPECIRYHNYNLKKDANNEFYLEGEEQEDEVQTRIPVNIFMGIDPASSTARTADYSCIMVLAFDAEKNTYVIDYFRRRVKPMALADQIMTWFKKYRPKKTQIETVGYQEMLRDYLRTGFSEYIPGLEIKNNPRKGKTERLESLQPEFGRGKVFLKPNMTEMYDELTMFPFAKNDDTLDAFYYARKGAYIPYHDVVLDPKEVKRRNIEQYDWISDG